jgi:hypothetical protein
MMDRMIDDSRFEDGIQKIEVDVAVASSMRSSIWRKSGDF